MNTIPAQEIKRRGISAVDALLKEGAVHVITQNVPTYVVMSEAQYRDFRDAVREASLARVRAAQADYAAGRFTRYANVDELLAAVDALPDDDVP